MKLVISDTYSPKCPNNEAKLMVLRAMLDFVNYLLRYGYATVERK